MWGGAGTGNIKPLGFEYMSTHFIFMSSAFVHVARPFPTMLKNSLCIIAQIVPLGLRTTHPIKLCDFVGIINVFVCG